MKITLTVEDNGQEIAKVEQEVNSEILKYERQRATDLPFLLSKVIDPAVRQIIVNYENNKKSA